MKKVKHLEKNETKDLYRELGRVISDRRNKLKLSQQQLAEMSGLLQPQVSEIERATTFSTLQSIGAVARALNVKLPDLIQEAVFDQMTMADGGAQHNDSFAVRLHSQIPEKRCLAEYVAFRLRGDYAGQNAAIDGGTTNQFLAEAIGRDLAAGRQSVGMVVTNHVGVPQRISQGVHAPGIKMTGGSYRPDRMTVCGPETVRMIEEFAFAVAIIGANSFDCPFLFTRLGRENDLKAAFMQASDHIFLPLDSSKWGQKTGQKLADVRKLVEMNKTVILVTAVPATAMTESASSDELQQRRKSITKSLTTLAQETQLEMKVEAIPIDLLSHERPELVSQPIKSFDMARIYHDLNPKKRREIGIALAVQLDQRHSRKTSA